MSKFSRAIIFQVASLGVLVMAVAVVGHYFDLSATIVKLEHRIAEMRGAPILYPLAYVCGNLLLLPCGVLVIGSGLFFGLWWGFFIILAGNVVAAAIAFGIARALGRQWVEKKISGHAKWRALDRAIDREGWRMIFLSQIHPLFPTSLLNYLYGITRIRFWPCMLWIALGQAPGIFLYVYLGTLAQLGIRLLQGKSHPGTLEYFVWIGGLVFTFAVTIALARIAHKLVDESERAAE